MARITPIDIIKGISGKYGKDAGFYFATNTSSGKIRISRLPKPSHRPPTEKQKEQRSRFAARHTAVTAWLNANKPGELNGPKGTEAYQHVQRLKRQLGLSLINQVLLKYMDGDNVIRLPETKEQRNCKPQKTQDEKNTKNTLLRWTLAEPLCRQATPKLLREFHHTRAKTLKTTCRSPDMTSILPEFWTDVFECFCFRAVVTRRAGRMETALSVQGLQSLQP